jgi:outer membrane receptor protein involved in Fe transport
LDGGLQWQSPRFVLGTYVFWNRIRNYVERAQIDPELYTFQNLTSGTIRGLEWEAAFSPLPTWNLFWRGHRMTGTDAENAQLFDLPPHRMTLGLAKSWSRFRVATDWRYRTGKEKVANGERPLDSAHLLSLLGQVRLKGGFELAFHASNLLNATYYPTADKKAALARGRSLGISLHWSAD